jgi:hypothetical protein
MHSFVARYCPIGMTMTCKTMDDIRKRIANFHEFIKRERGAYATVLGK